jgi:hypothetical protein
MIGAFVKRIVLMSFEGSEDKNMRRSILISSDAVEIETFLVLKRRNYAVKNRSTLYFYLISKNYSTEIRF